MSKPKGRMGERSAVTGQWVPKGTAAKRPSTTVREVIPLPGHGDTGRSK
jgi:hypothetical protein